MSSEVKEPPAWTHTVWRLYLECGSTVTRTYDRFYPGVTVFDCPCSSKYACNVEYRDLIAYENHDAPLGTASLGEVPPDLWAGIDAMIKSASDRTADTQRRLSAGV